ncbi:MIP/aquaporin family protein [Cutibacterium acnes]|uniref:MIP/aquaporin family protein n=1 Tax=Cutibacterium acnes TaxID=1747 RepID=UPI0001EF23AE|nr:MIP/aquaporin family protein [Cutibacterium acnes]AEW82567.1 Glycerol uptake facilitator protein [Cutibacterium acnes TypeIA2 P.acn17]EFS66843.1 MIP family channel protein [Cutibacterium acnes HL063PA2]EFT81719.1 MIP family channel protein [Cutibacterium acnes HL030PA2]MCM8874944.1 aquaporin family protein [Cutibacterium acnes]REB85245.1 aquaporin family protein [Cutibacterium acnes]
MLLETAVPGATIFGSEFLGTLILILLGCGVVANNLLPKSKGHANAPGSLQINWGWGFGVMFGVYAAYKTGGHLNPAVTVGLAIAGKDLAPGILATAGNITIYILAQFAGAFVGAVLCWLAYKQHYDEDCDPALKLGTFATGPEVRNPLWNTITEAIGTWVLVLWVILSGFTQGVKIGPLAVGLLIVSIGASLGGPTGYAINPARDLSPRIAHAVLPIKGKGDSDWGYAWVPVVGPMIGAVLAALTYSIFW